MLFWFWYVYQVASGFKFLSVCACETGSVWFDALKLTIMSYVLSYHDDLILFTVWVSSLAVRWIISWRLPGLRDSLQRRLLHLFSPPLSKRSFMWKLNAGWIEQEIQQQNNGKLFGNWGLQWLTRLWNCVMLSPCDLSQEGYTVFSTVGPWATYLANNSMSGWSLGLLWAYGRCLSLTYIIFLLRSYR